MPPMLPEPVPLCVKAINANAAEVLNENASKKINKKWSNPVNITPEVESDGNQFVSSLSFDGKAVSATYRRPYQAHASIGPSCAVALLKDDAMTVWTHSQGVFPLRTALAHILMSRDGVALKPGTRSYARSWIRDGAMMVAGLVRTGEVGVARDFVDWFAGYVYRSGKVPCCVDARGADPVPENDSDGEYLYAVAEVWRHTGDAAFLARHWPVVQRVVPHLESLRQSTRTDAFRAAHPANLWGLLPPSISHEGYSDKPAYSYWDDFWAVRGYRDAVELARAMGQPQLAAEWARWRDEFEDELARDRIEASAADAALDCHDCQTILRRANALVRDPACVEAASHGPGSMSGSSSRGRRRGPGDAPGSSGATSARAVRGRRHGSPLSRRGVRGNSGIAELDLVGGCAGFALAWVNGRRLVDGGEGGLQRLQLRAGLHVLLVNLPDHVRRRRAHAVPHRLHDGARRSGGGRRRRPAGAHHERHHVDPVDEEAAEEQVVAVDVEPVYVDAAHRYPADIGESQGGALEARLDQGRAFELLGA